MRRSTVRRVLASAVGVFLVCPAAVRAHEKWFHDATAFPTDWGAVIRFPGILAVAAAVAATTFVWLWWRARRGRGPISGPGGLGGPGAGRPPVSCLVPPLPRLPISLSPIVRRSHGAPFSPPHNP